MVHELGDKLVLAFDVFVCGHRREEIAQVGQTVGADRAAVGQLEGRAEVLADIAACNGIQQLDAKAHAARNDDDLLRLGFEDAQLRDKALAALLQHDQQFAVGAVERAIGHRAVRGIDMARAANLGVWVAVARHGDQTVKEVGASGR